MNTLERVNVAGVELTIPSYAYKPKSVVQFAEYIREAAEESNLLSGKRVLELGCGDHACLAHLAERFNAELVVASDIDDKAINILREFGSKGVVYVQSDLFTEIDNTFDVVFFNPPQMPMPVEKRANLSDWHDSVCNTGKSIIRSTIEQAPEYIVGGGVMYMMIFDFLLDDQELVELATRTGYEVDCVKTYRKYIRPGGQTEKSIPWISKIYPNYCFEEEAGIGKYVTSKVLRFKNVRT